jgi:Sec1 family
MDILLCQSSSLRLSYTVEDSRSWKKMIVNLTFNNSNLGLKALPGPHDYPQNESEFFNPKQTGQLLDGPARRKRILVYFVGGITYGEIAAIRFLNKIFDDKKFIIATT